MTDNPQVSSAAYCVPTTASGVIVVLPGQQNRLSASIHMQVCSAHTVVGLTPVVPGDIETLF